MDGLMMDEQLLLSSLLWRTERLFGDKEIITRLDGDRYHRYTYSEFAQRARRLASALVDLGVGPGDRIGTLAWNHYRHFELYYGIPGAGAVCHTVNLRLFPEQQRYIVNHAEDTILFVDPDQIPVVEQMLADGIPTVKLFVVLDDSVPEGTKLDPVISYEDLIARGRDDFEFVELDEKAAAAMCYTSATTGDPKGVLFSHRALVLQTILMATHDKLGLGESEVWMEVAPMFHCNGWNLPHAVLMQGATLVLLGVHPVARDYVKTIQDLGVTGMNAAVTVGTMMRDFILEDGGDWDLTSLKTMWLGGQAPPRAIMQWFGDQYGTWVLQGYGQTECSPQVAFNHIKTTRRDVDDETLWGRRLSGGIPLPLMKVKLVDAAGEELPWDGTSMGDLVVKSPYTASGYYQDEVRSKESNVGGWHRTGDIAAIDADGFIWLKDRSKDLIKSGGEWISSIDLENALMEHPKVREATVISVPDERWLERPVACVVPTDADLGEDDLRRHLSRSFAKWWIPDRFLLVSEIPKTSVGKYNKKELRAIVGEGGLDAVEAQIGYGTASTVRPA